LLSGGFRIHGVPVYMLLMHTVRLVCTSRILYCSILSVHFVIVSVGDQAAVC
jgi:hypothetical protein